MARQSANKIDATAVPARPAWRGVRGALGVLAAVSLVATLVLAGLLVCMAPPTTRLLAQSTSLDGVSPYTREELVALAVATRDYTLGASSDAELYQAEAEALADAIEDGRIGRSEIVLSPDLLRSGAQAPDLALAFAGASERHVLSRDALSHLDDCREVIGLAGGAAAISAVLTAGLAVACGRLGGRRLLEGVLLGAGVFVLAALVVVGGWALFDFDGFFEVFHSLFFAQGTWKFAWDSLLICMYPDAFWTGMATVWVVVSGVASAACVVAGLALRRRRA